MRAETDVQLAVRARAKTLVVATTGSVVLAATAAGYTRSAGSFLADGFYAGMEVAPVGFPQAAPGTIESITATQLTIKGGRTPAIAAANRMLIAGLPSRREWDNAKPSDETTPEPGHVYVAEQFAPGAWSPETIGKFAEVEAGPIYYLHICVPTGTGLLASRYTDALHRLFPPGVTIALLDGDEIAVRDDVTPRAGQLLPGKPGFAVKPFRIPLSVRSDNLV